MGQISVVGHLLRQGGLDEPVGDREAAFERQGLGQFLHCEGFTVAYGGQLC